MSAPGARRGVVCAGSIVVDVNATIDHYPARERLALIEDVEISTGGPGLNLAIDLHRLSADFPISLCGVVGDDDHGRFVLDACTGAGIDVRAVECTAAAATSYTKVMIERNGGRRTFFHHVGANGLLQPQHIDVTGSTAKLLHLGAPGLHPLMDKTLPDGGNGWSVVLAAARAGGLRTNLELVSVAPGRIREVALPCLPHLDYLIINELEAQALTGLGREVTGPDTEVAWPLLEASASRLVELGVARLAVVHFPAGCVAAAPNGRTWQQGCVRMPMDAVRSTVGAGDAFAAGVMHGLHADRPVPDCLELGVCSAAVSLLGSGTSDSLRPAAECLEYGHRHGFRAS
jgi:sugar/nucleoside kinase (ribokinase family)